MDPALLLGTWRFRREVNDHLDGGTFIATGEAEFGREPDGRIRWVENGTLRWAERSAPVTRTLFLVRPRAVPSSGNAQGDDAAATGAGPGDAWRVTFEDGRDFHPWTATPVDHPCGEDLYHGCAHFPDRVPDHWTMRWRVTGPAKDYTLVSYYTATPATRPSTRARSLGTEPRRVRQDDWDRAR